MTNYCKLKLLLKAVRHYCEEATLVKQDSYEFLATWWLEGSDVILR